MGVKAECGCGTVFEASRRSKYPRCADCSRRAERISHKKWLAKSKSVIAPLDAALERGVSNLSVVIDPLESGGFKPGTSFPKDYWTLMLKDMTFTPGTILRDGQQRLYEFQLRRDQNIPEKLEA